MSFGNQFQTPYGTAFATAGNGAGGMYKWGVGGFPRPSAPTLPPRPTNPPPPKPMPGGFPAPITLATSYQQDDSSPFTLTSDAPTLPEPQFPTIPATSAYGGSQNSTQRWQEAALAGAKPLSSARIFNDFNGRIDGRAPMAQVHSGLSYSDRGAAGFTPQAQWDAQFQGRNPDGSGGQIYIPKTTRR